MKVAAVQCNATDDKGYNLAKAVFFIQQAIRQKAKLIALPEVFIFRGKIRDKKILNNVAENIPGPTIGLLSTIAGKHKVFILAGSIYEKSPVGNRVYNASALINPQGKVAAKYRKMNLFDAVLGKRRLKESDTFLAGKKPVMTTIEKFKAGLSICYDARFPALYQFYSRHGADILFVPSAFTQKTGQAHWEVLLRARAIENLCYVIAPNQTGTDQRGVACFGHSMIINPWGEILAKASADKEEIIYADVEMRAIRANRKILPSLKK